MSTKKTRCDYPGWDEHDDRDDDEEPGTLLGYVCAGCGHTQKDKGLGDTCNRCGAAALDEWYD